LLDEQQVVVLSAELDRGALAHGHEQDRWMLKWVNDLIEDQPGPSGLPTGSASPVHGKGGKAGRFVRSSSSWPIPGHARSRLGHAFDPRLVAWDGTAPDSP
jgi:hypothetical protein